MECHRKTWNWFLCHTTCSCINFDIFLIEISRNKQAINKQFQKGMLNECLSINFNLLLRLQKKNNCHFYICLPYFKVWNFHWNIVSRNLLYRVSVVIFAGTSFCYYAKIYASHKNYFNSLKVCISLSNLFLLSLGCQK